MGATAVSGDKITKRRAFTLNLVECKASKAKLLGLPRKKPQHQTPLILKRGDGGRSQTPITADQGRAVGVGVGASELYPDRGETLQSIRSSAVITLPSVLFEYFHHGHGILRRGKGREQGEEEKNSG